MSNFSKMQKLLIDNRISFKDKVKFIVEDTKPKNEDVAPEEKEEKKLAVDTSGKDVFFRLRAQKRSYHNIPATPLVANLNAVINALGKVKKTDSVIDLVSYLRSLLNDVKASASKSDTTSGVVSNLTAIQAQLQKIYDQTLSTIPVKKESETTKVFDVEKQSFIEKPVTVTPQEEKANTVVSEKVDEYIDIFSSKAHKPVEEAVAKILKKISISAKGKDNYSSLILKKLDTAIDRMKDEQNADAISYSFAVFPSEDMSMVPYGITQSLSTVYKQISKLSNIELKDSDGKTDTIAEVAIRRLLSFIDEQAESIVSSFERPGKYSIKAAVTDPKEVNKVLISYKSDDTTLPKTKNLWDYIEDKSTYNAETLSDIFEVISEITKNLSNTAKNLVNKDTNKSIWTQVEPFFYSGGKPKHPDFLKLALYFIPEELFNAVISRRDLVILISNSETVKKNRFLYNIKYVVQNGNQASIIKDPTLLYWADRVKAAAKTKDTIKGVVNDLTDQIKSLVDIPEEFFADSLSNAAVNNITDQIYYRLISTYGSQADLQRLEKISGVPSGKDFLSVDAKERVHYDIETLLNKRKAGESLTRRIKTDIVPNYVRVNTISSILKTKGDISKEITQAISKALNTENILDAVNTCKDLKGTQQTGKFKQILYINLKNALDELDPSGKLGNLLPLDTTEPVVDPKSEEGMRLEAEKVAQNDSKLKEIQKNIDSLDSSRVVLNNKYTLLNKERELILSKLNKRTGPAAISTPIKPVPPTEPEPLTNGASEAEKNTHAFKVQRYKEKLDQYKEALTTYEKEIEEYPKRKAEFDAAKEIFLQGDDANPGLVILREKLKDNNSQIKTIKSEIEDTHSQIKQLKIERQELTSETINGSAISVNTGVVGAIKKTVSSLQALTEDDISKIVKVLSSNKDLLKYTISQSSAIEVTPEIKAELSTVFDEVTSLIGTHSQNAKNVLPRLENYKHYFTSGDVSKNTINGFLNVVESAGLQDNQELADHLVKLENILDLPTDEEEINLESEQYQTIKIALKELVKHRKLEDVYKNPLRNDGFDLVLHDFDAFIKKWISYFSELSDRRAESETIAKQTEKSKDLAKKLTDLANEKREQDARLSKVLLPGSTISGEATATTPEQLKIIFLSNLKQFAQNARSIYNMIKNIVETNPKLKKYISTGSGVFDVGDTVAGTKDELEAFEQFNAFAIKKQFEHLEKGGSKKTFDKTSDELWKESGISDEFRPFILKKLHDASKTLADTGSDTFDSDIYDIFAPVIAKFQRRLSTRPSELGGELDPQEAEALKRVTDDLPAPLLQKKSETLTGELSSDEVNLLNTTTELGYAAAFSDKHAVNVIRKIPNSRVKSILSDFFPDMTEKELISLKNSLVANDSAMDTYEALYRAWEETEQKNAELVSKGEKPFTNRKPNKPTPTTAPILSDLIPNEDTRNELKDRVREFARKTKVIKLPAFKTFASVLRRAIDNGDIKNPVRIEHQSSAANLDQRVSAFLNLAAGVKDFKDINNFLMGTIGRSSSVVDTLFDATTYPAAVVQDRNIVLCTRLYIIQSLLTAASSGNLSQEFKNVTIHILADEQSEEKKINESAQKTFESHIAEVIVKAFSPGGTLEKEYEKTYTLLKTSIEGSNGVIPVLTKTGDLVSKTMIDSNNDEDIKKLIQSRGSIALELMRTSSKVSDGIKPLLTKLANPEELGNLLNNCVKIIASGINYITGREATKELAKAQDMDERTAVEAYDNDPQWSQFINTFKIVKKGVTEPTLVALESDNTTGYHNLSNKYLSIFIREFSEIFSNLQRLEKDTAVEKAEELDDEKFKTRSNEVRNLPAYITGIYTSKDTDLITGTVSSLSTPAGKQLKTEAEKKSETAAKKFLSTGESTPIETVSTREARPGEEIRDELHGPSIIAKGGELVNNISVKGQLRALRDTKNVTSDILSGVTKSASVKTKQKFGPLYQNIPIKGLRVYHMDLRDALIKVIEIFKKVASGFEDAEVINQELDNYKKNVFNAIGQLDNAFYKSLYEGGKLDIFNPEKQKLAMQYLKFIPFPLNSKSENNVTEPIDSVVSILTRSKKAQGSEVLDELSDFNTRIFGAISGSKKNEKDDTARLLWEAVINELIINGQYTGAQVFEQFIQLLRTAPVPPGAIKLAKPVKPKKIEKTSIDLSTDKTRALFKSKFIESFFSPVADPSILINGITETLGQIDANEPSEDELAYSVPRDGETSEEKKIREATLERLTKERMDKFNAVQSERDVLRNTIKKYLAGVVVSVLFRANSDITKFNKLSKVSGNENTSPNYQALNSFYEKFLSPVYNHLNTLVKLDSFSDNSSQTGIQSLSNQLGSIKNNLDKMKSQSLVAESIIKSNVAIVEATTPDSMEDKQNALNKALAQIIAYYKFNLRDRLADNNDATFRVAIEEIRKEFMVTFLFTVLPSTSAFKKWVNLSSRQEPFIRFKVLPDIKIELHTDNPAEGSNLYITTDSGEKNYVRSTLDVPINDFELLGWLGNHTYSHMSAFEQPDAESPNE